jgi:hypothetical protein
MLHRLPHFADVLSREDSIRCMLVRSGTSRLLLLDGVEVRPGKAGHDQVRRIMLGSDGHGGYGGRSSQENKVALVWSGVESGTFRFRFLQVIAQSGAILPMECSNSASASAMLAQLGDDVGRPISMWKATNLSTGQKIELRPEPGPRIAKAWRVRFLASPASREALAGLGGPCHVRVLGQRVEITPVALGNLFLFTKIDPTRLDSASSEIIARAGMQAARAAGFAAPEGYHPKVIPYRITSTSSREVETASYYHGELHHSMPGSAAMALAAYLEMHESRSRGKSARWRIQHTSGSLEVRLGIEAGRGDFRLAWTEFSTPVGLLGWGVADLPRRLRRS